MEISKPVVADSQESSPSISRSRRGGGFRVPFAELANPIDRGGRVGDDARGRDGGATGGVHGGGGRRAGALAAPGSHSLAHPHAHPSPRPLRRPAAARSAYALRPAVPPHPPPGDAFFSARVESCLLALSSM